jgi:phosphohistidine phosphatase SixA
MLKYLSIFLALALSSCSNGGADESGPTTDQPVTIFLVRHAEKDLEIGHAEKDLEIAEDPPLTPVGEERAELLGRLLADAGIATIFSSDTRRTLSTAAPLANQLGLEPIIYNPKQDPSDLLPIFLNARERGNILIVGHSNTIPATVNALLGEERYSNLDESTYDKVFVVHHWGMQEAAAYMLSVGAGNEKIPVGARN